MKKVFKIYEIVSGTKPSDFELKEHSYINNINEFKTLKEAEKFMVVEHGNFGYGLIILPVYLSV